MDNIKFLSVSLITATLLFTGCGSSNDSSTNKSPAAKTGTFVDAPVKGLHYKTATQDGYTNDKGEFKYVAGETVEFKLGNLSLGKGVASTLITPYTLSDTNDTATNIALLLQNFDGNRTNTAILDLSPLKDANLSDVKLSISTSDMETKLGNLFSDSRFASKYSGSVLLDSATVKSTMDNYLDNSTIKTLQSQLSDKHISFGSGSGDYYFHRNGTFTHNTADGSDSNIPGVWSINNNNNLVWNLNNSEDIIFKFHNDVLAVNTKFTVIKGVDSDGPATGDTGVLSIFESIDN